ncbi:UDP-glucose/GDP-mannose dehydrogenase family protein [Bacillus sp. sid0103]|uniref:UDP-glucose dehydrogenase family protein n=1 Tax=Bacillus sp. sid0103 TaxID=2856337 RepID=UPI001C475306|nr:UDP-glucose/GDP-mannose dehydrogenase family protein [Bacillus sp. sid0103]MBV7508136.1 UDP-glucose/GDP-mannose dehydrogenase family protein [Bacillus sp. sid0103]
MKKIAIAGTGYVGLVTGVCLAEIGHDVICVERDHHKVRTLNNGYSPIYEPGLDELLKKNIAEGRLRFTSSPTIGYKSAEVIMITVGTPQNENGALDLLYIEQISKEIARSIKRNNVIVVTKSTVPVGTNKKIKNWIQSEMQSSLKFQLVSNPEFISQGTAIYDTFHGDRIIIGSDSKEALNTLEELYRPIGTPIFKTDMNSAELIKVASNSFLALKISYVNALASLCEHAGGNIEDVSFGMGLDTRIGSSFLKAGVGFGGSCLPKDTHALVQMGNDSGEAFNLIEEVIKVNKKQELKLVEKALNRFKSLRGKRAAILGLSFKPNTDDVREAVSIKLAKRLVHEGATVIAYDPVSIPNAKKVLGEQIFYADTVEEALLYADLTFIVTEWEEIKNLQLNLFNELMKEPVIFDGRNCFHLETIKKYPVEYYSIGRPIVIGKISTLHQ